MYYYLFIIFYHLLQFPVLNNELLVLEVIVYDKERHRFDNFSSLHWKWSSSDSTLLPLNPPNSQWRHYGNRGKEEREREGGREGGRGGGREGEGGREGDTLKGFFVFLSLGNCCNCVVAHQNFIIGHRNHELIN